MKQNQEQNTPYKNQENIPINTPLEYIAFKLPRMALPMLLTTGALTLGTIGIVIINYFFIGHNDFTSWLLYIIQIVISLVFLFQAFLIYGNTIKRNDIIIQRLHRGGIITFDKQHINKKVEFDPRDITTEISVLWNGAALEKQSGAKVLQLKEGNKSNENINLCVPESDWSKNLKSMVRLKTFADLAEEDLLNNKNLLGLKWQDLALILIAILIIIGIIINIGIVPNITTDTIIKALKDGVLQNIISSVMVGGN